MEDKTDIQFPYAYISFLNTFAVKVNKEISCDDSVKKLNNIGIKAESSEQYLKHFQIVESFLLSKSIAQQYHRLKTDGFTISLPHLPENCPINSRIKVNTFLTIYPRFDISTLLFNLHLENCTVDELIFLMQCFEDRFKIDVDSDELNELNTNNIFIRDILLEYIKLISTAFGLKPGTPNIFKSRCIEIPGLSNSEIQDPQALLDRFPRQIYGLLTSDEGWRFVPEDVAIEKTNMKWRTRNFVLAIPLHFCVLLINMLNGDTHKQYIKSQKLIRTKFGCSLEEYFKIKPKIAGLKHGPLLILEISSIQYYMLDQVLYKITEAKPKSVRDFLTQREELTEALSKLAKFKIQEVRILGENIGKTMLLENKINNVTKRLEEIERALIVKYNQRINYFMLTLTVFGIIFAIFSASDSIKQFFRLIYSLLRGLL